MYIGTQIANLYASASLQAENISQALYGEPIRLIQQHAHWSKIQLLNDAYIGFIQNHHIVDDQRRNTHRIVQRTTPVFTAPDIKSPTTQILLLGSELPLTASEHKPFFTNGEGQYIWREHTSSLSTTHAGTLVETAERAFLGAPYLWGGRSPLGLDCSSMVQLAALLHGWSLPRDTRDQIQFFEHAQLDSSKSEPFTVQSIEYVNRQTNDLVYWPGHVAILLNNDWVLHATAHSLQCCKETLQAVEQRAGTPHSLWRLQTTVNGA